MLENAIIKHETLICKCNPELKQKICKKGQNTELPKIKNVKCLYCNKLFATEPNRNHHIIDVHQNAETVNGCPEFKQNAELSKIKKVKCLYCNKLFKKESYRNQHIRDKHQNDETTNGYPEYFVCCYCGIKLLVEQN